MDLLGLIKELQARKQQLDRTIAALETLESQTPAKRRGRKFMGEAERQAVAERMRRYWANRRNRAAGGD
jgi:hypothetical protein